MISFDSELILSWVTAFFIPLTRILGFISIAPIFGDKSVALPVKVGLGMLLTMIVTAAIPPLPTIDLLSPAGALLIIQQMIIGLAIGFMMRIIFFAIDMAGQLCGLTMGFGFASFFDPQSQANTAVISQFFGILAILVFLSMNGHLMMISALVESFLTFPVASESSHINGMTLALWGGNIFKFGLQLSLPIVATLLIANMALGVLTRSAPQLNIFGIGFPITLGVGFVVITLILPSMLYPIQNFFEQTFSAIQMAFKNQ